MITNLPGFRDHIVTAHPGQLVCLECGFQALTESGLTNHRNQAHLHAQIRCPFCYQRFPYRGAQGEHIVMIHQAVLEELIFYGTYVPMRKGDP